jgi:hypothetical protein
MTSDRLVFSYTSAGNRLFDTVGLITLHGGLWFHGYLKVIAHQLP